MADEKHLEILRQGAEAWNEWRAHNLEILPDLSGEDLTEIKFVEANPNPNEYLPIRTNLNQANLSNCVLAGNLSCVQFNGAYLNKTQFLNADLIRAEMRGVNLSGAFINDSNLTIADLSGANLSGAGIEWTILKSTSLDGADLTGARLNVVTLANIDLSKVKGLETVNHMSSTTIGIDTIYRSKGNIPEVFLRGAGISEEFINYMKSLIGKAIEFYSCFISYSSKDEEFVQRIYADLQNKMVRCWFAPEDLKIGAKIRPSIDTAIMLHDKVLLILSERSIDSDWVEKEVETAFEEEQKRNQVVLFPIRLDDTVMETKHAWAADIRRTRHVGDFREWKNYDVYQKSLDRLLRDLKTQE